MNWNSSKGWLSKLALDQDCILCKQVSQELLCPVCSNDIEPFNLHQYDFNLLNHIRIARELKTAEFERLIAIGDYQWPISQLISDLKFAHKAYNGKALAELFCANSLPDEAIPQAIIPIPLHLNRLVERQFNQTVVIAKHIAKRLDIDCLADALTRRKKTQAQTQLNATQRIRNVKNAFELKSKIVYRHVALFDDVITTGATLSAAVDCLSGAYPTMRIDAWAMCVTPQNR
ncbi:ComF family protein [Aliiglaciecola litoralis]|uniref:ComF family protein n=1 Tax=Aliiglaciecola litoralis TaxID=582857 RepID=A0ABP3WPV7_9ALTE